MGFFKNLFGATSDKVAKKAVETFATLDPETATDVQIRNYEDVVTQKAQLVARAQTRVSDIQNQLSTAESNKTRFTEAAKLLLGNGKNADEALSKAEDAKNDIVTLTSDLTQAQADLQQYTESHKHSVDVLLQAKKNIERKIAEGTRLDDRIQRAQEAQKDAKAAAGLDHSIDSSTIISDTFDSKNKKKEQELAALDVTNNALNSATSGSKDLEEALKTVDGKPTMSAEDRLKALES